MAEVDEMIKLHRELKETTNAARAEEIRDRINELRILMSPFMDSETRKEIDDLGFRERVLRLEHMCQTYWPQYNWKLLRVKFFDSCPNADFDYNRLHQDWYFQIRGWLAAGRRSNPAIALLSVRI